MIRGNENRPQPCAYYFEISGNGCERKVNFGLCRKRNYGCKGFDEYPSVVACPVDLEVVRVN